MCDAVFPDQQPKKREYAKKTYTYDPNSKEAVTEVGRDAGMLYIKKDYFYKIGKWNEKMRIHNGEQDIYNRIPRQITTNQTMIMHVEHGSGYEKSALYPEKYNEDCRITQGL
jgi:hypothetical protein